MATKDQTVLHDSNYALNLAFDVRSASLMPATQDLPPAPDKPPKPQQFTITIAAGERTMSHPPAIPHPPTQPKLLDQVRTMIHMMHYSRRIEDAYIDWIKRFVDNKPWQAHEKRIPKNKIMCIRIARDEVESRNRVKAAGGKWDPKRQVWQLPYEKATELGLADRIVGNEPI